MSTLNVAVQLARNAKTVQSRTALYTAVLLHVLYTTHATLSETITIHFLAIHSPEHQKPTCTRHFKVSMVSSPVIGVSSQ